MRRVAKCLFGVLLVAVLPAASEEPLDLVGAWYVLVHYSEAESGDAWEDKVWVFEPRGSRLGWTEYPMVVLRDDQGREESLASGRVLRSAGHWNPSARQREEIAAGPGVVAGWARSKTLRGHANTGYRSHGAVNRESTGVIGYSERWEIDGLTGLPVFRRSDEMSGGRAKALAGLVEYRATKLTPEVVAGTYLRDADLVGTFSMIRVKQPRPVSGDAPDEEAAK